MHINAHSVSCIIQFKQDSDVSINFHHDSQYQILWQYIQTFLTLFYPYRKTDRKTDVAIASDTWPKWGLAKNCGFLISLTSLYQVLCSLGWEAKLGKLRKWAWQTNEISRKIIREKKEEERWTRPEKKWDKPVTKEINEEIMFLDTTKCILIFRPSNNSV